MKHYDLIDCPKHIKNYILQTPEFKKLQNELVRLKKENSYGSFDFFYMMIIDKIINLDKVWMSDGQSRLFRLPRPVARALDSIKKGSPWGHSPGQPKNPIIALQNEKIRQEQINGPYRKLNSEFNHLAESARIKHKFQMVGPTVQVYLEDWEEVWAVIKLTPTD